jgi:two-component system cell cycle response regulator
MEAVPDDTPVRHSTVSHETEEKTLITGPAGTVNASSGSRAYLILLAGDTVGEMFSLSGTQVLGRGTNADLRIRGQGISRQHCRLTTTKEAVVLEDLGSTNGTYVNGARITRQVLHDGDKIQVGNSIILKFTYHDNLDEDFQRHMYESASRDGLTRIYNKRYFMDQLNAELRYSRRHDVPLAILMLDLDHFKRINDTYGHPAGDQVLVALTNVVSGIVRAEDLFARYGGEEFVVLSRNTDLEAAVVIADRIRENVGSQVFNFGGEQVKVTVSIGVASLPSGDSPLADEVIAAADRALYQAKHEGRNRVVVDKA